MEVNFAGATTRAIVVEEQSQVGQARREAQQLAASLGFGETDAGRAALVATELATNVIKHGRGGQLFLSAIAGHDCTGLGICAIDRGPGFQLAEGLRDGYSTGGTRGIGLGGIQRQTQWLDAYSDARGAVVAVRLYPGGRGDADLGYGGWRLPLQGEPVCGDAWHLHRDAEGVTLTMIDGLGHGAAAADAANAGIVAVSSAQPQTREPVALLARMHAAMAGTRGGAAAVARYDRAGRSLRYAGTGNIAGTLIGSDAQSRGLPSHPGIVGVGPPPRPRADLVFTDAGGKLLVMHSDGIQARWSLKDYPGLALRHPALVAAVLVRDFDRGRDDASLLVVKLGD
jgi:anti-sigma regulatory factor (Ser/Thr protein kinase)